MDPRLDPIRRRLAPLRAALLEHPIYGRMNAIEDLRVFMSHHVFAVWDFMSLLKALQRVVCRVEVPWTPPPDPAAAHLVNAIVLGEESDEDGAGGYASHFDLYRRAMIHAGAETTAIDRFVLAIERGESIPQAFERTEAPESVRRFVAETFDLIDRGDPAAIASAFTFGREDLLPDVFGRIVAGLDGSAGADLAGFRHYLDRHIELDGDDHGPMAARLVASLCGDDPSRWAAAEDAAVRALESRLRLWDGIADAIRSRPSGSGEAEDRVGDVRLLQ